MTTTSPPQVSFSSGEVSPLLARRFDYQRNQTGLATCNGFAPLVEGGFTRLPGTEFDGATHLDGQATLVGFKFAANDAMVLEFTNLNLRFWRYGELVEDPGAPGTPLQLATPFAEANLGDLRWQQSADVIYITDGKGPIQKLSRFALDQWTIAPANYLSGPFRVQNLDKGKTIQASGETGSITLTASSPMFEANHVGSLMMLQPTDFDVVPLWTSNTPIGPGTRLRNDGNTYEVVEGTDTKDSPPYHKEGIERVQNSPPVRYRFINDGRGIVRITGLTSATVVTADVIKPVPRECVNNATYRWSEGAWNERYGYPSVIIIDDDQRFVAAATPSEPRTVWFSTIGDYEGFEPSVEADGSFAYTVSGQDSLNKIVALARGRAGVHIFGAGEEFSAQRTQAGQAIGPTTARFHRDSEIGAASVNAISPRGSPIFITRDRRRIFQISYVFQSDGNEARELSRPAAHFGTIPFEQIVWQASPQPIAWIRREDGSLAMMLHDPPEDVLGWARHSLAGGVVESLAVTPDQAGTNDVLTMVVKREVDGQTKRYVERLSTTYGVLSGAQPITEANHAFAATIFEPPSPTDTFTVSHLVGLEVYAWTDDGQFGPYVVPSNGEVTLGAPVGRAIIGLFDETHVAETLDIQASAPDGSTVGRRKRLSGRGGIGLHRTAAGFYQTNEASLGQTPRLSQKKRLIDRQVASVLTDAFSGVIPAAFASGNATEQSIRFSPDGLAPMTVTAVVPPIREAGL